MTMSGLLSKLSTISSQKPLEPREIFMSLPRRAKNYEYPRDVQSEVWKKWYSVRDRKNCIIKMNTGSGKTVVGLMILQSCLNEGKGPAAYVVPDNYLVDQVCAEANRLGISVTANRDDYLYSENRSILVMPIQALVNGRSVFGMRSSGNYPLGSVLIDDVHACLDTITTQFSIKIPATHELYSKIVAIFSERWKAYNSTAYTNIVELRDPAKIALIPFWIWQESTPAVFRALSEYNNDAEGNKEIFFSLPLLENNLSTCNCVITSQCLEISPFGIAIDRITQFDNANRRIFMSATLSDDSVFVSSIGLKEEDIDIISPDFANDIGDRLILFPKHLNNRISNEDIRDRIKEMSTTNNIVVIVPSYEQARLWDETGSSIINRENIVETVKKLKEHHVGLVVLVNRYDGIDLPNDACRLLVIDGLPPLRSEYDKYVQSIDASSSILLREQIQRIEQGMGRGIRSNSDSCCIVLMGDNLADVLIRNKGMTRFSNATQKQYKLSNDLWNLLRAEKDTPTIDEIFKLADYSLKREDEWVQISKENLASVNYNCTPQLDRISLALRKAYEFSFSKQWREAADEIDKAILPDLPNSTKGYLLQIKASYTNFIDQLQSQQILLTAHRLNTGVLSPIEGIRYNKVINDMEQAKAICEYANSVAGNPNEYILYFDALASRLVFSPNAEEFEQAFSEVGKFLGFKSSRPDKETHGAGPDNLWAVGNGHYFVIECKTGATADTISKDYCNQLGGSVRWFSSTYDDNYTCVPIMVHKSKRIDRLATPEPNMRIITMDCIEKLKTRIKDFAIAMVQNENWLREDRVNILINKHHLQGKELLQEYSVGYER